jgi:small subunit ribosomal protein S16
LVKIRLRRIGAKKSPSYRLVVADARAPRDGAFITIIGHYNPLTDPETIVIDEEKARHWLSRGAQTTDTAARLLAKAGIIEEPKARKEKIKAGAPAKPKGKKKKAKAEAAEEPEAEVTEEAKAKAAEEPKAEVTEEVKAKAAEEAKAEVTEEPKAEATEESKTIKEEPEASITEKAETTAEEPKASKKKAKAGEEQTETTKEQS